MQSDVTDSQITRNSTKKCLLLEINIIAKFLLFKMKYITGSCSVKKNVFWDVMYFSPGVGNVLDSTTPAEKNSCSVESGGTLAKLGVLLKICLFAWNIEVFWILIERIIVYRNTWLGN